MKNKFDLEVALKELKEIGHTIKILVVEDEPITRNQLHFILSEFCNNIDLAENGMEALFLYQEKKYDLIITDLMMPEMSGIDMLHEFQKFGSDIKVIVASAHNESEILMELLQIGAHGFIKKPFDQNQILTTIYKICQQINEKKMHSYLNSTLESLNQELLNDTKSLKKELEQLKNGKEEAKNEYIESLQSPSSDTKKCQMIEIIHQHVEKMSAMDFFETYPLELDQTNEDLEELENRLNHLILNANRQTPQDLIHDLVSIVSNYAKTIEAIPQFGALAFAIKELAYTFESAQDKMQITNILPILSAFVNNLEQWRLQIFFYRNAEDIHYMDHSILSDAMSLKAMLDGSQEDSSDDEFEFF